MKNIKMIVDDQNIYIEIDGSIGTNHANFAVQTRQTLVLNAEVEHRYWNERQPIRENADAQENECKTTIHESFGAQWEKHRARTSLQQARNPKIPQMLHLRLDYINNSHRLKLLTKSMLCPTKENI